MRRACGRKKFAGGQREKRREREKNRKRRKLLLPSLPRRCIFARSRTGDKRGYADKLGAMRCSIYVAKRRSSVETRKRVQLSGAEQYALHSAY